MALLISTNLILVCTGYTLYVDGENENEKRNIVNAHMYDTKNARKNNLIKNPLFLCLVDTNR